MWDYTSFFMDEEFKYQIKLFILFKMETKTVLLLNPIDALTLLVESICRSQILTCTFHNMSQNFNLDKYTQLTCYPVVSLLRPDTHVCVCVCVCAFNIEPYQ